MARNIKKIASALGAEIIGPVPETRGGAFGAARLAHVVETMQGRLKPGQGRRPGRPTDPNWVRHPKVPMSDATKQRLTILAEKVSGEGQKISPMQLAAQILEEAVASVSEG